MRTPELGDIILVRWQQQDEWIPGLVIELQPKIDWMEVTAFVKNGPVVWPVALSGYGAFWKYRQKPKARTRRMWLVQAGRKHPFAGTYWGLSKQGEERWGLSRAQATRYAQKPSWFDEDSDIVYRPVSVRIGAKNK